MLTNVITNAKLSIICYNFVVFLVFQCFLANWVVARHLATRLLMLLNFNKRYYFWTVAALDLEGVDNLFNYAGGTSNLDVSVAHRAISVQNKPVLNAKLAKQFVTVVALLSIPRQFCKT